MLIDKIYVGEATPSTTNVVWIKPLETEGFALYSFLRGKWSLVRIVNANGTPYSNDDKPVTGASGHFVVFGDNGELIDSGVSTTDSSTKEYVDDRIADILGIDAEQVQELIDIISDDDTVTGLLTELKNKANKSDLQNVAYTNKANIFRAGLPNNPFAMNTFYVGGGGLAIKYGDGGQMDAHEGLILRSDGIDFYANPIGADTNNPEACCSLVKLDREPRLCMYEGQDSINAKPLAYLEDIQEQVQSDWEETDTTSKAYIQNKPSIPTKTEIDEALSEKADKSEMYESVQVYYYSKSLNEDYLSCDQKLTYQNYPTSFSVKKAGTYRFIGKATIATDGDYVLRLYHNDTYKNMGTFSRAGSKRFDEIVEAAQGDTIRIYFEDSNGNEGSIDITEIILTEFSKIEILKERYNHLDEEAVRIKRYTLTYDGDFNSSNEYQTTDGIFKVSYGSLTTNSKFLVNLNYYPNSLAFEARGSNRYIRVYPPTDCNSLHVFFNVIVFKDDLDNLIIGNSYNQTTFKVSYEGNTKYSMYNFFSWNNSSVPDRFVKQVDFIISPKKDVPIVVDFGFDSKTLITIFLRNVRMEVNPTEISTVGITNNYNDLEDKPNFKTINNNSILGSGNVNVGTITGITMNGTSKGTSGVVNLGTVLTSTTASATSGSTLPITSGGVYTALQNKQNTLVSGSTIKTINGVSILGSGNIEVDSGMSVVNNPSTTLSAARNTYYNYGLTTGNISVTLPSSSLKVGDKCVFYFYIGSSSFSISGGSIAKELDFEIKAYTAQEVTAMYNGIDWILSVKYLKEASPMLIGCELRYGNGSDILYASDDDGTLPRKIRFWPGPSIDYTTLYLKLTFNKSLNDSNNTYNLVCSIDDRGDLNYDSSAYPYGKEIDSKDSTVGYVTYRIAYNSDVGGTASIYWKGASLSENIEIARIKRD